MAELRIALGATADVLSSKEMDDRITGLQGHLDKRFETLRKSDGIRPIRRKLVASQTVSNTIGSQAISQLIFHETPSVSRLWVIRSFAVFNASTPLTSEQAGTNCFLAVGNAASPSPADLTGDTWTGIPHANTYNSSSIRVNAGENAYVVINASVIGDIAGTLEIDEWMDVAYSQQRI